MNYDNETARLNATYDRLVGEVLEANALEGAGISLTDGKGNMPSIGEMQDALAAHRGDPPPLSFLTALADAMQAAEDYGQHVVDRPNL